MGQATADDPAPIAINNENRERNEGFWLRMDAGDSVMTHEAAGERFDCIRFVREVRARIAEETAGMSHAERIQYYRTYRYDDPVLERLAAPLRELDEDKKG